MVLPGLAEYNEAIQNLGSCVSDEELRKGRVVVGPLGIPRLYSGNFADVYRVHCPATGNTWAVKLFTREVPHLREHYREIKAHLTEARLPFMVDFSYVEPGIRVGQQWYPFLKMRWVEGPALYQFVEEHLEQPTALRELLKLWGKLAVRLRAAGVAHGDLQPSHVLFAPGSRAGQLTLRLIDYDGMYVPGLAGSRSLELGHPAYQHPQRLSQRDYGPESDRFSHLVIYCMLRCLIAGGRALWDRYYNGDNLLVGEQDLAAPEKSPVFRELWGLSDPAARDLVGHLILAAKGRLADVPRLDELVVDSEVTPLTGHQQWKIEQLMSTGEWVEYSIPLCEALELAREAIQEFVKSCPRSFPPIVINISSGGATDGDPEPAAAALRDVTTEDGNVLLFNVHITSGKQEPVEFPDSESRLGGADARRLFRMSSPLPPQWIAEAQSLRYGVAEGARGFASDGDLVSVVEFFDIGTRIQRNPASYSSYSAEIGQSNPTCFLFLMDQSEAMNLPFGRTPGKRRADRAADAINRLLQTLVFRCARGNIVLDRYYIGVIAYGSRVGTGLGGALAGQGLVPVSQIANNPLRIESRVKKIDDGAGGLVGQVLKFPIWFEGLSDAHREHESRVDGKTTDRGTDPVDGNRPLVFISAKSEDYHHARRYYEYLTSAGLRAFLSTVSLAELGTSDFREAIDNMLDEAKHMVVVTSSPENARSSWVQAEWGFFVNEKRSDRKKGNLVTVIIGDMPIADLPPGLRYYEVIRSGAESFEKVLRYVRR